MSRLSGAEKTRRYRERHPDRIKVQRERGREQKNRKARERQASRFRFLAALKLTAGCIDCGYRKDPARLHFDHRDGTVKEFNIAVGWGASWERLLAEIEKCEVRCNPCHERRHGLKRGGLNGGTAKALHARWGSR